MCRLTSDCLNQTGAGIGMACDDEVREILLKYVQYPPGRRPAWPETPFALGALRQLSALEPEWSGPEWTAAHDPHISRTFIPMSCSGQPVPPVLWAPPIDRVEHPHFTKPEETLLANAALEYGTKSVSERSALIDKWIAPNGAFARFSQRKTTIQRALRTRCNSQTLKSASATALSAVLKATTKGGGVVDGDDAVQQSSLVVANTIATVAQSEVDDPNAEVEGASAHAQLD